MLRVLPLGVAGWSGDGGEYDLGAICGQQPDEQEQPSAPLENPGASCGETNGCLHLTQRVLHAVRSREAVRHVEEDPIEKIQRGRAAGSKLILGEGFMTAHVGTAFALAKTQLAIGGFTGLYAVGDVKHPSQRGTFLAASTMYATIYNKSPVGIKLLPWLARRVYKPFALKAQKWAANATLQ
ncbi:hypothetical protein BASA82_000116 [Batrachochytrium salamandrivorans]|nr:hypothetical protein BASA82_000116 [Batrachochytrium salamandrivorans]